MRWPFSRPKTIVLLYHRIASVTPDPWSLCVTPEHFEEHLQILRRYRRVRLDQLVRGLRSSGPPTVAVTFDDGYADNCLNACPLLKRFETPATFFIATGAVESPLEFWWDELERIVLGSADGMDRYTRLYERLQPLPQVAQNSLLEGMSEGQSRDSRPTHRTLTRAELTRMASCELFEIGAHTVTHPLLAAQTPEVQRWELLSSKQWLEEFLDRPVTSTSYPYGGTHHYNHATLEAAESAGFARACTTVPQHVDKRSSPWEWGRFVVSDMDGDGFQEFLSAL